MDKSAWRQIAVAWPSAFVIFLLIQILVVAILALIGFTTGWPGLQLGLGPVSWFDVTAAHLRVSIGIGPGILVVAAALAVVATIPVRTRAYFGNWRGSRLST